MTKLGISLFAGVLLTGSALTVVPAYTAEDLPPLTTLAAEKAPTQFSSVDDTVAAFKNAVAAGDFNKLAELLGLDPAKAQAVDGTKDAFALIQEGVKRNVAVVDQDGVSVVMIGDRLWPFPFPISKKDDGKWSFDTYAGLDEIKARRVGENEITTIETINAYVSAQYAYAEEDRDGDGVLEYAQKLISTADNRDGLLWQSEADDADSPGGEGLVNAEFSKAKKGGGFFGYHYRILTGQGSNIAGGQYDYVINGNMIVGFGLVAWPVEYGGTGVHTFVVNKDGVVYQADLGQNTSSLAAGITRFNPNANWELVTDDSKANDETAN